MESNGPPRRDDPSTLHRPRFELPSQGHAYTLVVIEGPDRGKRFALDPAQPTPILVGQGPACGIRLSDREVSRRHVKIDASGRKVRVTDLGSTNGTFIDGVPIVEAYLAPDAVVRIGATALQVTSGPAAPSASSSSSATSFGRTFGASPEMRRLYPLCERLAASGAPVIVEGEAGTGKEVLAESLHEMGARAGAPFVVFDCAATPAGRAEEELFGGASKGVFEQAHQGTLLLDEIGELDVGVQSKLFRALERAEVTRAGARVPVDVRVIVATRRDLDHETESGRFREDLLQHLAVARVELPPLRRRRGDIEFLARHMGRELGADEQTLTAEQLVRWQDYTWPGNVRELRQAITRLVTLGDLASLAQGDAAAGGAGDTSGIARFVEQALARDFPLTRARQSMIEIFDRLYIEKILKKHKGSVIRAASDAGVARRYFQILKARQKG